MIHADSEFFLHVSFLTTTGDNSIDVSVASNSNQKPQSSLHHECSNARIAKVVNTGLTDVLSKQASFSN